MRNRLPEEAITQAAKKVAASMQVSLPIPEECHHEFTPGFENDMQQLISQVKKKYRVRRYLQHIAAACLAATIGLSAWLAFDSGARAAVLQWMKTVYEKSVVYEFFSSGDEQEESAYRLGWVPEGYCLEGQMDGNGLAVITYKNNEDFINFIYTHSAGGGQAELFTGEVEAEPVTVNGNAGDFYLSETPSESNNLVWFDETNNIWFSISGFVDKESMLRMAEHIEKVPLSNTTN